MTDKEILEKVYERLKDRYHSPENKMFGTVSFIEKEWQKRDEEETVQQYNRNREVKDHITDVSEMERHRGLEIGPDGTVTEVK